MVGLVDQSVFLDCSDKKFLELICNRKTRPGMYSPLLRHYIECAIQFLISLQNFKITVFRNNKINHMS